MASGIPLNSNFMGLSCQLGNLTLNGNVANGTAQNYNILTINDPAAIITDSSGAFNFKFLSISIANQNYYLPLYQS